MWVRIDNRLVHGQIIESWVPHVQARDIWVVNDELAADELRKEIMRLAVPQGVDILFSTPSMITGDLERKYIGRYERKDFLVLFASCRDAKSAFEQGFDFSLLNVANIHYSPGKKQICDHVALNEEDISCIGFFSRKGVRLDFRCVPNKPVQVRTLW
ncbi:MAG: PTS sugar transporter subunit IIB [Desulfovibrionales bacterium]